MTPGSTVLGTLNNGFIMPSGTRYGAVAGTFSTPNFDLSLGSPNDCLVSVNSVEGPFPSNTVTRPVAHRGPCTTAPSSLLDDQPPGNSPATDCNVDTAHRQHVFCDVLANVSPAQVTITA